MAAFLALRSGASLLRVSLSREQMVSANSLFFTSVLSSLELLRLHSLFYLPLSASAQACRLKFPLKRKMDSTTMSVPATNSGVKVKP